MRKTNPLARGNKMFLIVGNLILNPLGGLVPIAAPFGSMYQAMNEGSDRRRCASNASRVGVTPWG